MAHNIGYVSSPVAVHDPARHARLDPRAAFFANWRRGLDNANVDLLCAEGMLFPVGYTMTRPKHTMLWPNAHQAFLRSRANSIVGGTT